MAHSYVCCYVHYIFSVSGRRRLVTDEIRKRLWPYMGGVARENGIMPVEIGGTDDHAHVLVTLPATMTVSRGVQLIKGISSKWVSEAFKGVRDFQWQEGYGGFSVSKSAVDDVVRYIRDQEEHHRERTFEEEYLAFLDRYGVEYDLKYVFD